METITRKVNCYCLKNISLISLTIAALLFFTYSTPKNENGYIERIYIVENKTNNNIDNSTLYESIRDTVLSLLDTSDSDSFNDYEYNADYDEYDVENKTMDEMIDDYESSEKESTVQSTLESSEKDDGIGSHSPFSPSYSEGNEKTSNLITDTENPSIQNKNTENPSTPYKDTEKPSTQNQISTEENLSKKELDEIWLRKMEDRFERRRSRLKEGCKKLKSNLHYSSKRTLQSNIYMATKYDLLVCAVAKAGSSTWKTHLLTLNGYTTSGNVHVSTNEKKIRAGRLISLPAVYKRMHDNAYTRVMNARHPLDRLVSAYRDKYNDGGVFDDGKFKKEAASHLNKSGKDLKRISFEDFLKIVIRDQWAGLENAHWRNYYRTCSPCQLTYDYIMKVETYSEDLSYIFRKIGVTEIDTELRKHGKASISDRAKYEKYYEDIPDDLLRKVHQLYKEDYELFGYDVPRFVKRSL